MKTNKCVAFVETKNETIEIVVGDSKNDGSVNRQVGTLVADSEPTDGEMEEVPYPHTK